jgi:putative FmdB family regulatory protein
MKFAERYQNFMSTYDYSCGKCGYEEEHVHGMMEKPEINCPKCNAIMDKIFSHNFGGFILKGGTPAINYREKQYRQKRSEEMYRRQTERYGTGGARVKPNIAGVETGTWEAAHKIAQEIKPETGIFPETYAPLAAKEKQGKIITP